MRTPRYIKTWLGTPLPLPWVLSRHRANVQCPGSHFRREILGRRLRSRKGEAWAGDGDGEADNDAGGLGCGERGASWNLDKDARCEKGAHKDGQFLGAGRLLALQSPPTCLRSIPRDAEVGGGGEGEGEGGREGGEKEEGREHRPENRYELGSPAFLLSVGMVGSSHLAGTAAAGAWEGTSATACAACPACRAEAQDPVLPIARAEASWGEGQLPALGSGIWVGGASFGETDFTFGKPWLSRRPRLDPPPPG